jgi:DNA polymerase-1
MSDAPVFIIDAMNYIFRAFYAVPPDITTPSGMPKNAILGYTRTLLRILKEHQPEFMVAAFEGHGSFRSAMFQDYKANRALTPEGLAPQINYCRKITEAIGIPTYDAETFEADDVIGTIAMKMWSRGYGAVIVTGDKDMSQLVREGVRIYDIANSVWLDEVGVYARFGVRPHQIPDLLALNGDAVDNIPGVPGVGPKTACQILSFCSGIEELAGNGQHLQALPIRSRDRVLRHIRDNIESVRMSRKLATIRCDVPLTINPDTVRYRRGDRSQLSPLCEELGFLSLMGEIPLAREKPMLGDW